MYVVGLLYTATLWYIVGQPHTITYMPREWSPFDRHLTFFSLRRASLVQIKQKSKPQSFIADAVAKYQ